jgi:hypothetical protein
MKFHVVWPTRERLATDMLQDPNDPACLHALPGLSGFPFSFSRSLSLHRRPERNVFGPPRLSP